MLVKKSNVWNELSRIKYLIEKYIVLECFGLYERCVILLNMMLDKEFKDEDGKYIIVRKIYSRRFKVIKGVVNKVMLFVYILFEL